ncbi:MAG: glycosyltransferase [Lachnospiraceae bacterium]|nr:glycosyltransferase [Lachnospiraceae bacterium]
MRILYVYGMAHTKDIPITLRKLGYKVEEYPKVQDNSILNDEETEELVAYIRRHRITHLMSIHLIYNLAVAAYRAEIKYVSVIWDAPYIKIYTPFGKLDNCWFSVFDRLDNERFREAGIPHTLYQPLAVNKADVIMWNRKAKKVLEGKYINDICFVGNLYEDNLFDERVKNMPQVIVDYFNSIFEEAAFRWDGINRIYGKTSKEMLKYMEMVSPDFRIDNRLDIEDTYLFEVIYLVRKIANIERIAVLNTLSEAYHVVLHTTSEVGADKLGNVEVRLPVRPGEDATVVYAGSKINLNISLKGIEGGTIQRIIDIMGAGGFVLTNYCVETAELFEEDKEIVMYRTPEELFEKVEYYLQHDEEREQIAKAGCDKVIECYTYEKKLKKLLDWVEGNS